jgi:starch-binding outer membrane protein, SusD/RagB family
MKKAKYIIFLTLIMVFALSCSENFLTKAPLGVTSENIFYDAKGINALLTGTYAMVGGKGDTYENWDITWGSSVTAWTFGGIAGGDAYKGSTETDQIPINEIERWDIQTTNGYAADKWKWYLKGVTRANGVLKVLKGTKNLTAEQATEFEAETRFLRGWFNFEAWLVFKNIAIIKEDTPDATKVPNNVDAMPAIVEDLTFAMNNLPDVSLQIEPGRPSKYAAMAVLARAYMQTLDYASAKPLLDGIIASGKFSLRPNFFDNFDIAHRNNSESIYEIERAINNGSTDGGSADIGTGLNAPQGSDIGTCCGFYQPSQDLVNAFKVDANGLPLLDTYNQVDLKNDMNVNSSDPFIPFTDVVDPRLDFTVSRRGIPYMDWGVNRGNDWIRLQSNGGPYLPAPKAFYKKAEKSAAAPSTGWQGGVSTNNFRYYRLSHVLLWRAEIAASEGDLPKALDLVNQIRNRAKTGPRVMGLVTTYSLPTTVYPFNLNIDLTKPAANYDIQPYPSFPNKDYAMKAVQFEMRLEFAMEGSRFFDLRRWGLAKTVLNQYAKDDLRTRQFLTGATVTDKSLLAPIPQTQIDLQPGVLVQNPGY